LLGSYLSVPPSSVTFKYNHNGKPSLDQSHVDLFFNMTHSANLVLVAICRLGEVGVDVERLKEFDDLMEVAGRYFAKEEILSLERASTDNRVSLFFRFWTGKESYIKFRGKRISDASLKRIDLAEASAGLKSWEIKKRVQVKWLVPATQYIAGIVCDVRCERFFCHRWQPPEPLKIMSKEPGLYRNVSSATAAGLAELMSTGKILRVRNQEIREVRNKIIVLAQPLERCLFVPHRRNNIVISIAETMWVLGGRNDMEWLQAYLPRAAEFSDDGVTWRAGYGPRLRNWRGVDQIDKVRQLLLAESSTRRAAMSLYDPGSDFVESKDIPCNNWLHWLVREGKLHLNVGVRSNDIVWGFSGINSFEWSVLHEMMSFWIGADIGEATYFASSFHVYERHYLMAERATKAFGGVYPYDYGLLPPRFHTPWNEFAKSLDSWFKLEAQLRQNPDAFLQVSDHLTDPLLVTFLDIIKLHHGKASGWTNSRIRDELSKMPANDFTASAYEFYARENAGLIQEIPSELVSKFLDVYLADGNNYQASTR